MNASIKREKAQTKSLRDKLLLLLLILSALGLSGRLAYLYLGDAERFPIRKVKVAASYQHLDQKKLEAILSRYLDVSFFAFSVAELQNELNELSWIDKAYVLRVWPDTIKIRLVEKKPVAIWDGALMTEAGILFNKGAVPEDLEVPTLIGPPSQQLEVLQVYKKLSKILSEYELKASGLQLSENQAWVLILNSGTKIYLGKNELELRLERFCKAYPAVFAAKINQLASVDLRYPRGMAVQWKQQTER